MPSTSTENQELGQDTLPTQSNEEINVPEDERAPVDQESFQENQDEPLVPFERQESSVKEISDDDADVTNSVEEDVAQEITEPEAIIEDKPVENQSEAVEPVQEQEFSDFEEDVKDLQQTTVLEQPPIVDVPQPEPQRAKSDEKQALIQENLTLETPQNTDAPQPEPQEAKKEEERVPVKQSPVPEPPKVVNAPQPEPQQAKRDEKSVPAKKFPVKDLKPVRGPSRNKRVSFNELQATQRAEKENSNLKNNDSNTSSLQVPKDATKRENTVEGRPSVDNNKMIGKALQNALRDKSNMKISISKFSVAKQDGNAKPLSEKLKLFVTKRPGMGSGESNALKQTENSAERRPDVPHSSRKRHNASMNLPFDEVSYLEQQLKMAETDRLRLRADLHTVEESIVQLKASVTRARNARTLNEPLQNVNLNDSTMLVGKLDRMRREQIERSLRIKQKTQADQDSILRQLEEQTREREERYSVDKRNKIAQSIERIKQRADSRKKQLLVANKVMKALMEPEDPFSGYYRFKTETTRTERVE